MRVSAALALLAVMLPGSVLAQADSSDADSDLVPYVLPEADLRKAALDDEKRQLYGQVAHFAVPIDVDVTPFDPNRWQVDPNNARWRLRLRSPGAISLSLAFSSYYMPEGGSLVISSADGTERIGPFTAADNEEHGQLWTPPILSADIVLELTLPAEPVVNEQMLDELELTLARVHHGYAGFGDELPLSGLCQRDAACVDDPVWHEVARSVAMISVEGVRYCSGFMVNNTALDGKPLFITAHHCGVTAENAPSVVVMWNYESPSCRDAEDFTLAEVRRPSDHFQSGAFLRAAFEPTDVTLLELDDLPGAEWGVHYAGWDRSGDEPKGATVFHHPNTDLKRLSVDHGHAKSTFYLEDRVAVEGSHLRVGAWEVGTTEGGSSGAPLFDEAQRAIGQLHGGFAECGEKKADWFGRLAVSWDGGGKPGARLSDWLDPLGTESVVLDGLDSSDLLDP